MSFSYRSYSVPTLSRASAVLGKNNTGSTIPKATVVQINATDLDLVDPSVEADVNATVGVTISSIANTQTGEVIDSGTIEDVTGTFTFGDTVYLSKTGTLTEDAPTIGVNSFVHGDYIIKVGVIIKNALIPAQKDLLVNLEIVGQL